MASVPRAETGEQPWAHEPRAGQYVYTIFGEVDLNGEKLGTGDAAKVRGEEAIRLRAVAATELVLVEVPMT